MVKHRVFAALTLLEVAVLATLVLYCDARRQRERASVVPANRQLARQLELTDLAIWTEARYTRHPSQADRFAPFQDLPSSLEHFPAGSVVQPPMRAPEPARGSN
jgi:hypothetical protein